jgi:hypothetical protein
MYNAYLVKKPTGKDIGDGVFTTVTIPAEAPILELKGELIQGYCDLPDAKQIGHDLYLGLSGEIDDYINHSCNPSCVLHIVGTRAFLYSLYVIPADTEITFDYSTSSTDSAREWKMECQCGDLNCRKIISGFQYLDPQLREELKNSKKVPLFMRHSVFGGK